MKVSLRNIFYSFSYSLTVIVFFMDFHGQGYWIYMSLRESQTSLDLFLCLAAIHDSFL